MTPGAGVLTQGCGNTIHIVKIHYFFKKSYSLLRGMVGQTKCIVMMTKERSTKIVNFMTPGAGVLALGRGQGSKSEHALFL